MQGAPSRSSKLAPTGHHHANPPGQNTFAGVTKKEEP
jgi:hypothetical protein